MPEQAQWDWDAYRAGFGAAILGVDTLRKRHAADLAADAAELTGGCTPEAADVILRAVLNRMRFTSASIGDIPGGDR